MTTDQPRSPCVVVIGVSGSGKTTTARLLAAQLGIPFADADDFHPPTNIAKMRSEIPLDDTDREPWLDAIGRWLHDRGTEGHGGVIACSALKRRYRDTLRAAAPRTLLPAPHRRPRTVDRADHRPPRPLHARSPIRFAAGNAGTAATRRAGHYRPSRRTPRGHRTIRGRPHPEVPRPIRPRKIRPRKNRQ